MRTNVEDDVVADGRLSAFAREMGKDERDALGWLVFTWRDTQSAKFSSGRREHLRRVLSVRFGAHADQVIDAMINALLADVRRERIAIRGNQSQIKRLDLLRQKKTKAGVARAKSASRGKDGTFSPALNQHEPAQSSAPAPAPAPAPKDLRSKTCAVVEDSSLAAPLAALDRPVLVASDPPPKSKPKSRRNPEQAARALAVNRRYRQRYEERKGHEPTGMDAAFNTKLARFADKHADNALDIVDWFFDSPNPKYRNAHYSLGALVNDFEADRLWGEVKNKRSALQGIAAPIADRQLAVSVNNALVIEEVLSVMPQIAAGRENAKLGS